jgi:hypothetical protein
MARRLPGFTKGGKYKLEDVKNEIKERGINKRLTIDQVKEVKRLNIAGLRPADISRQTNVSYVSVWAIVNEAYHKHVTV